jgi:hypothetical protein
MLERLIAAIDAEDQKQQIGAERFVREQRILDELAPRMWQSFWAALKAESEKYPNHFTFDVRPNTEAVIRGKGRRSKVLEVRFLTESKTVCVRCGDLEEEYTVQLDAQGKAVVCDVNGQSYSSRKLLAEQLLALILN